MPELPEVESVRRGLADLVAGRRVTDVEVLHPRLVRRQPEGPDGFTGLLRGQRLLAPRRRGKFLWLPLGDGVTAADRALLVHLGMSGQVRVLTADGPVHPHTRVRCRLDDGRDLRFVDMRMFGRLEVDDLLPCGDDPTDTAPALVAHIGRDPLDPRFDAEAWQRRLRLRRTEVKRALLDQTLASGIGNIYADEALWRTRLHWARPAARLTRGTALTLLGHVRDVMTESMASGGTSFDALYVDVDGESGYYGRRLAVYGRDGMPCLRCGSPVRRDPWMNRSAYSCPGCQPRPRAVSSTR